MVSFIACLSVRCSSECMSVMMWECSTLDRYLDVTKFATLTLLSVLILCELAFPIFDVKIYSLPSVALRSRYRIFIWYLQDLIKYMVQFLIEAVLCTISFIFWWALKFITVISHQQPLSIIYNILSLTNYPVDC
jgi:hypothetical protein